MQKEERSQEGKGSEVDPKLFDLVLKSEFLSEKQVKFVESIKLFKQERGYLTLGQLDYWWRVYEDHKPEAVLNKYKWKKEYNEERRETAKICAAYYLNAPGTKYFRDLAANILSDDSFVPTEKQWRAMCTNKYAKKVLETTRAPARYSPGTFVEFRKGNMPHFAKAEGLQNCGIVLETDAYPVSSAAKGTKIYKILLVGDNKPLYTEERRIKKYRGKKCKRLKER
tara:strand:+ start:1650 stop:2324 length:675 start_codon:yes stop_codon:yes gene_type:complete